MKNILDLLTFFIILILAFGFVTFCQKKDPDNLGLLNAKINKEEILHLVKSS
tara:strand:- start:61 stop:216 length:156 start_codon:yes stop_codon:yes gene_type:complete